MDMKRYRPQRGHYFRLRSAVTGYVICPADAARMGKGTWVAEKVVRPRPLSDAALKRARKRFDDSL